MIHVRAEAGRSIRNAAGGKSSWQPDQEENAELKMSGDSPDIYPSNRI